MIEPNFLFLFFLTMALLTVGVFIFGSVTTNGWFLTRNSV